MERVIGYTRSEVVDHARWHMDYMDLLVRKRVAVCKWREAKERDRARLQAQAALLGSETAGEVHALASLFAPPLPLGAERRPPLPAETVDVS